MTQLTRRHVLAGAATATAASALAPLAAHSPAYAAAPLAGKQTPGWYRYKVGDFEVTVVTDGWRPTKVPDNFIRNAPRETWSAGLAGVYMDKENPAFPFTPFVVNTGSKLVVVDTGNGLTTFEQSKGALGQFHSNLAASGIDTKSVDAVVISHFHGDHISGLLGPDNKLAFPNAEVMVPAAEWKYWMDDANMNSAPEGILKNTHANVRRVFGSLGNKVTQYDAGKEIVPGITTVATPGHTPGHTSYLISSGPATLMAQVDVTAGPALLFVRNPDYQPAFDFDGPQAVATRRKLYDQLAADKMLTQGFHLPFPAVGYIEKDGNGYRYVPVPWNPTV
jgi:glyoxylase-like metal-dependent hydrolase (beta-lactamase superfamily II)